MIEALLMAAAKRRAAASAGITVNEDRIAGVPSGSNNTVTFAGIPADGRKIFLIAGNSQGSSGAITFPAGFSTPISVGIGSSRPFALAWKLASSEASAAYTITGGGGSMVAHGFVISGAHASPIGNGSARSVSDGTSAAMLGTAIDITAGSLVIASVIGSTSAAGAAFDNSFNTAVVTTGASRSIATATRLYVSGATSQNSTATWTSTMTNPKTMMVEILAA